MRITPSEVCSLYLCHPAKKTFGLFGRLGFPLFWRRITKVALRRTAWEQLLREHSQAQAIIFLKNFRGWKFWNNLVVGSSVQAAAFNDGAASTDAQIHDPSVPIAPHQLLLQQHRGQLEDKLAASINFSTKSLRPFNLWPAVAVIAKVIYSSYWLNTAII